MYRVLYIIAVVSALVGRDISPLFTLKASGLVSDFVVDGGKLYVATSRGSIDIFDLSTRKVVDSILLEPTRTARGELIDTSIYSVDRLNGKTLFVSRGSNGYRIVWVYANFQLKKLIDIDQKILPKKARFIDDEHILLGTFGSDIMLLDSDEGYRVYESHISQSAMGGMVLSDNKKEMVVADESGAVRIVDVASSRIIFEPPPQNLDNVYRVAYKNGTIITAGQDRRVGVYPPHRTPYYIRSDFLVYCVGLSSDGAVGVYSSGMDNNLQLFDTKTRLKKDILVGHNSVVNKIEFVSRDMIISAGDEESIFIWRFD